MARRKAPADELTVSEARKAVRQIVDVTNTFRDADARRRRMMRDANDRGVTVREIAAAIGESPSAVAYWIRLERQAAEGSV